MKTRTFVAICVALFGAVFAVTWIKPKRARRRGWIYPFVLIALGLYSEWWNPTTWWSGVSSLTSNVVTTIESWVQTAIHLAMSAFDAALQITISGLESTLTWAEGIASTAWNWGNEALGWIAQSTNIIWGAIGTFWDATWRDVVVPFVDGLVNVVQAGINAVSDFANQVESALSWWVDQVITPLWDWFQSINDWVANELQNAWNYWWANVIAPVFNEVAWLWDQGTNLFAWILATAIPWVQALIEMGDWVLWFGEHPIAAIEQLGGDLETTMVNGWVHSMLNADSGLASGLEHDLVQVLGGI